MNICKQIMLAAAIIGMTASAYALHEIKVASPIMAHFKGSADFGKDLAKERLQAAQVVESKLGTVTLIKAVPKTR